VYDTLYKKGFYTNILLMMSKKMGGIRPQQVFIVVNYPNLQYFVILITHEQHFWYFFWFGRRL